LAFSKSGDKESIAKIVGELNRRWTRKESQRRKK
jgi:hypothetical protein